MAAPLKVIKREGYIVKKGVGPQGPAGMAGVHAAASKTPPIDADEMPIVDSAESFGLKKLTFANLKTWVKGFLGAAAQLNVGTASGTVAAGDDSRILLGASAKQPGTTLAHYGITDAARAPEKKTIPFTAVVGGLYQLETFYISVSDPVGLPTVGDSYEVIVGSTCIFMQFNNTGTAYMPSRFPIRREYNGSAWVTTQPFLSDGLSFSTAAKATTKTNLGLVAADVSDSGAAGRALLRAATSAAARAELGVVATVVITPSAYAALVLDGTVSETTIYLVTE